MSEVIDVVTLPTLHGGQVEAWRRRSRFFAVRCGRRWGKTTFGITWACDGAVKGEPVGWFAPDYKRMSEVYEVAKEILGPVLERKSKTAGEIRTDTGGGVDFWTLEDETAGRGRKYKRAIVDEAAFTNDKTMFDTTWRKAMRPTLVDLRGACMALSNTNGENDQNFFWRICNQPEHGFTTYHAPSSSNPLLPPEELAALKLSEHPLVWLQEYEAEFVDWSGVAFFEKAKMLVHGAAVAMPIICDCVFATIDTATKTGRKNDGTGVTYWALLGTAHPLGYKLAILDWDVQQIEGDLLIEWLPSVFVRLEELARECRARMGSVGAWIEDKNSGTILLQQAARLGMNAHVIDSRLTGLGKSERAINVSGYVYRGEVKFTGQAFDKVTIYKGNARNHLLRQVLDFRIGDQDKDKEDDLLDTFTYGISIGLGDSGGF